MKIDDYVNKKSVHLRKSFNEQMEILENHILIRTRGRRLLSRFFLLVSQTIHFVEGRFELVH